MNTKEIVRPAIVLLLIAGIAGGCLGTVSAITEAPIAAQEEKTLNESLQAVMPEATSFEELTDVEKTGTISGVYLADNGGYVITTEPGGFSGAVLIPKALSPVCALPAIPKHPVWAQKQPTLLSMNSLLVNPAAWL